MFVLGLGLIPASILSGIFYNLYLNNLDKTLLYLGYTFKLLLIVIRIIVLLVVLWYIQKNS